VADLGTVVRLKLGNMWEHLVAAAAEEPDTAALEELKMAVDMSILGLQPAGIVGAGPVRAPAG